MGVVRANVRMRLPVSVIARRCCRYSSSGRCGCQRKQQESAKSHRDVLSAGSVSPEASDYNNRILISYIPYVSSRCAQFVDNYRGNYHRAAADHVVPEKRGPGEKEAGEDGCFSPQNAPEGAS